MPMGEALAALHPDGVVNDSRAVGQVAAITAAEGAGNLDILDRIIIGVAQREGHQRVRPQPSALPALRRYRQTVRHRASLRRRVRIKRGTIRYGGRGPPARVPQPPGRPSPAGSSGFRLNPTVATNLPR